MESFRKEYSDAVDLVITAARKMKAVLDIESGGYHDPEEPFVRLSADGYCLKMAYRIWVDVHTQMQPAQPALPSNSMGFQLFGPFTKMLAPEGDAHDQEVQTETVTATISEDTANEAVRIVRGLLRAGSISIDKLAVDTQPLSDETNLNS